MWCFFMDSIIEDVRVRKILDSRGNPTVEVDILTWNGFGRAAAPSGASTGSREVVSFPQGGSMLSQLPNYVHTVNAIFIKKTPIFLTIC